MTNHTGKRHRLLDAAVQLWRQGQALSSMTVQQLAQAAGVGKGTVYEYFSCREELLAQAEQLRERMGGEAPQT